MSFAFFSPITNTRVLGCQLYCLSPIQQKAVQKNPPKTQQKVAHFNEPRAYLVTNKFTGCFLPDTNCYHALYGTQIRDAQATQLKRGENWHRLQFLRSPFCPGGGAFQRHKVCNANIETTQHHELKFTDSHVYCKLGNYLVVWLVSTKETHIRLLITKSTKKTKASVLLLRRCGTKGRWTFTSAPVTKEPISSGIRENPSISLTLRRPVQVGQCVHGFCLKPQFAQPWIWTRPAELHFVSSTNEAKSKHIQVGPV